MFCLVRAISLHKNSKNAEIFFPIMPTMTTVIFTTGKEDYDVHQKGNQTQWRTLCKRYQKTVEKLKNIFNLFSFMALKRRVVYSLNHFHFKWPANGVMRVNEWNSLFGSRRSHLWALECVRRQRTPNSQIFDICYNFHHSSYGKWQLSVSKRDWLAGSWLQYTTTTITIIFYFSY